MKIKKLLIANRGEIACRIMQTAKKRNIKTLAIFTPDDANARHTRLADESHPIDNYLNINEIIAIAKKTKAQAIHPAYGFLAENYLLAKKLAATKIKLIAPPPQAIKKMGQKNIAKQLMKKNNITTIKGYDGTKQQTAFLQKKANEIGYPILIKASAGGGGKGMRKVAKPTQFKQALISAKLEAKNSFGNDNVILEKYIENPKHIEVQIFADKFGNVVHMFERDCTVQRKYQKIIEEALVPAPAPTNFLSEKIRSELGEVACKIARLVNYEGAGTVEFIFESKTQKFYFLEMNTRLQVEHRITELITGIDLVAWQIEIAEGKKLPKQQNEITQSGHAIQARICAENPANNFAPSIGEIVKLTAPQQTPDTIFAKIFAKIFDSGYETGDKIPPAYDSLIAKWIVHAKNRTSAIKKLKQVLTDTHIFGIDTNIAFLLAILENKQFLHGNFDTSLIENNLTKLIEKNKIDNNLIAIGITELIKKELDNTSITAWHNDSFQLFGKTSIEFQCLINGKPHKFQIKIEKDKIKIYHNKKWLVVKNGAKNIGYEIFHHNEKIYIGKNGITVAFEKINFENTNQDTQQENIISAPLHGQIVNISCKKGDKVKKGDLLFSLEAMKMEHSIYAKHNATIAEIKIKIGEQIKENDIAIKLK